MSVMQRRRSSVRGESADEALEGMIAEAQEEREGRRALSAPRRMEGGVRRLELQAVTEGDGRAQGREGEVARPAGLPQALGPAGSSSAESAWWWEIANGGRTVPLGCCARCGWCGG